MIAARLFLTACLILPLTAYSETQVSPGMLEQQAVKLGNSALMLILKYYHVQSDELNNDLRVELDRHVNDMNQAEAELLSSLEESYSSKTQRIDKHWRDAINYLGENLEEMDSNAFPELGVVSLMRESLKAMSSELNQLAEDIRFKHEIQRSEPRVWSDEQRQLILVIAEQYMERAASTTGAPLSPSESTIDEHIAQFSKNLEQFPESSQSESAMRSIKSRWLFIKKSAKDDNQRMVPLLVMKYTESIFNQLSELAKIA